MNSEGQHQALLTQLTNSLQECVNQAQKPSHLSNRHKVCRSKITKLRHTVKHERHRRLQIKSDLRKEQHRRSKAEISDLFHQIEVLKSRQEVTALELELKRKELVIEQLEQQCLILQHQLSGKEAEINNQTFGIKTQAKKVKKLEENVHDLQAENKLSNTIFKNEGRSILKLVKKTKQQQQQLNNDISKVVETSAQRTTELMGGLGKLVAELRDHTSIFVNKSLIQSNVVNSFGSRPNFERTRLTEEKLVVSDFRDLEENERSLKVKPVGPNSCPVQGQEFLIGELLGKSSKTH